MDRDAVRVQRTRQLGREAAALDARDLCRRERHDLHRFIVPVPGVEVVEVAPGGADDDDLASAHCCPFDRAASTTFPDRSVRSPGSNGNWQTGNRRQPATGKQATGKRQGLPASGL